MENETLIQYMQIVVKWARLHTHEMMYETMNALHIQIYHEMKQYY